MSTVRFSKEDKRIIAYLDDCLLFHVGRRKEPVTEKSHVLDAMTEIMLNVEHGMLSVKDLRNLL